ncbi:hypothetical protein GIB67_000307 [Kingdonia uniflora]|uniref:Uncharacterized protein n=1 Tax=Kingdonia uniflora TaxID=39325 RepID=A0A7J7LCI6_9MAGN|nr:hypothetical protein GIB67_000307 [Kingdonia uniflora]
MVKQDLEKTEHLSTNEDPLRGSFEHPSLYSFFGCTQWKPKQNVMLEKVREYSYNRGAVKMPSCSPGPAQSFCEYVSLKKKSTVHNMCAGEYSQSFCEICMEEKQRESLQLFISLNSPNSSSSTSSSKAQLFIAGESPRERKREREREQRNRRSFKHQGNWIKVSAEIYAKVHYGTSLSNVDWLHGGAESLLTITNLFIVIGLRQALRKAKDANVSTTNTVLEVKDKLYI